MKNDIKKLLFLAKNPNSAYSRYRHSNIIENLNPEKYQGIINGDIDTADILVLGRQSAGLKNIKKTIKTAKERNLKIVFDIDDDVFEYSLIPYLTRHDKKNPLFWYAYIRKIRLLAKSSDIITATNDFLVRKLKNTFHKPIYVIPNFLNKKQVEVSENLQKSDTFTVGYFSGSHTHDEDFALIEDQIVRFLNNHKDARLLVVGDLTLSQKFDFLSERIIRKPKVDYIKLQKYYAEATINLAPLVVNDFTNCKSELKFFESAVAQTVTLASPSFAFKNSIINGETGFICKDDEWYDKLDYLYSHPSEIEKIAKSAKKYCLENYYGDKIKRNIESVYEKLIDKD